MRGRLSLTVLLAMTMGTALTATAEDKLGRLFLTPERRAALEQRRQFNIQEQQTMQGATMSLDGVVVRSSGKKTVWINGRPQNDGSNEYGLSTRVTSDRPGQAGIGAGDGGNTTLRVGQSVNRATSEINDGIGGGKLEVKPPTPRR